MTRDEAIEAIRNNWPDERYSMLREALDVALAALSTPPAGEAERLREALYLLGETVQDIRRMADAVDRGVATRDGCRAFADRVSVARQRIASPCAPTSRQMPTMPPCGE